MISRLNPIADPIAMRGVARSGRNLIAVTDAAIERTAIGAIGAAKFLRVDLAINMVMARCAVVPDHEAIEVADPITRVRNDAAYAVPADDVEIIDEINLIFAPPRSVDPIDLAVAIDGILTPLIRPAIVDANPDEAEIAENTIFRVPIDNRSVSRAWDNELATRRHL